VFLYLRDLVLAGVECHHETATKPGLSGATDQWKQAYDQQSGFDWSEVAQGQGEAAAENMQETQEEAPQVAFWLDLHMLAANPEWHAWVLAMIPAVLALMTQDTPAVWASHGPQMACFQTTVWQEPLSGLTDRQRCWIKIEDGKWRPRGVSVEINDKPNEAQEHAEEHADEVYRTRDDDDADCSTMVVPDDHTSCTTPPISGSGQGDSESSNSSDGESERYCDSDSEGQPGDAEWTTPVQAPPAPTGTTEGGALA
jgi:hypothetical protein